MQPFCNFPKKWKKKNKEEQIRILIQIYAQSVVIKYVFDLFSIVLEYFGKPYRSRYANKNRKLFTKYFKYRNDAQKKNKSNFYSRTIVVFFRQIATQIYYATTASTNALEYLIDQGKVNDEVDDQSNERK